MMNLDLKDFKTIKDVKELFQVMALKHQIFVAWPSDKDNVKLFIYLRVFVIYNLHIEMIPLVKRAPNLKAKRCVALARTQLSIQHLTPS